MAMEALSSSNELFNFVIYDTISATPCSSGLISNAQDSSLSLDTNPNHTTDLFLNDNNLINHDQVVLFDHHHHHHHHYHQLFQTDGRDSATIASHEEEPAHVGNRRSNTNNTLGVEPSSSVGNIIKKKRKRKARVCKNKDEAETQRMTHIAVERNRRKQMNEHLAVLRSIMPDSYVQRGDQASIVGGAIEFVKELEHLLQSLEAQKLKLNLEATNTNNIEGCGNNNNNNTNNNSNNQDNNNIMEDSKFLAPPFSQFFVFPQYTWSQASKKYTSKTAAAIADIEVTLIETHASLRILSRRSLRQLSKLVAGFHSLHLTVLHLNVTTMSPLVLYSVSVKVEEECLLNSVDDIAAAVHHMLRIIEEEAAALC